ncbi:MAG: hypothetical protein JWP57_2295, partial [Spirosoma sp.]|nr:hypothetical protein [Spirosoma sp.]
MAQTNASARLYPTSMNENWQSVYTTPLPHRAELAKALLAEHDIPAVVVN